jgi:polyphenol oxidase
VTTRALGDMKSEQGRQSLRAQLPADPLWLRQVHGVKVVDADGAAQGTAADASFTTRKNVVCAVMAADCMPILFADERGEAVGAAHAGWRGLSAGVIEATVAAMNVPPGRLLAWLGPAIGSEVYEIGEEVRNAFLQRDANSASAFAPTRPGHWRLDLYAVARQRLAALNVSRVYGGGFCTATDTARFFSYRRDKAVERMAAAVWLS